MTAFHIDPDITKATTLPALFYRDREVFEALREKIFTKTWQWVGDSQLVPLEGYVHPFILLDQYLTEPLLLSKSQAGEITCLSNVCTHRGNLVVHNPGPAKKLQCLYHGRRFSLSGDFEFMPEFKEARDFPRACDSLHQFPVARWNQFVFVGLEPSFSLQGVIEKMQQRVGFLPLDTFKFEPTLSKDYLVNAHWALYCDNYLEGFHIPFVHEDLSKALDYGSYATEIDEYFNLQIGYAKSGEHAFDLPKDHIDYGKAVAAYYYWVFPNMMFNFYPWGLSINIVRPLTMDRTKVSFLTYVYDSSKLHDGAGALLDKVEREDEFVVEGVQKGIRSRYYQAGRYSPTREKGVHHFHRLIAAFLAKA